MAQPDRPLRADAARNRARVLEVAYDTFAAEGFSVPIDEIARRAGVGAGTVYRHFPTKEDLYRAVVEDRIGNIVDEGRALPGRNDPGDGLFTFLRRWCCNGVRPIEDWPTHSPASGSTSSPRCPDVEEDFLGLLGDLLRAGAESGHGAARCRRAGREGDPGRLPCDAGRQAGCGRAADRGRFGRSSRTVNGRPCTLPGRVLKMQLALATSEC